ncbi:MAG: malonyl-ACP O-methyltransferase BioC [Methylococcales symbiont of Hymedesmia sp. n. MRB-2018]|nr:MAG: malonyl-ACP O-methyltransferase BioC [Methylococcales symbiont of Hymedesmia sp. n. MRB-2018]KAF3982932.1 MAG: malonyl-ACP O-methyltransferase BioC [Methylococcales symbiont of Hymedesmia sp. n. MRB-2018]
MSAAFATEKNKIRRSFSAAANRYDDSALLQRQVALDLISRFDINIANEQVIDLGCGTGFLMQQLMSTESAKQMIAIDIAHSMLYIARRKLKHLNNIQFICADAEKLPLPMATVDKIVSNLALQWCVDLNTVFQDFKRVLKADGQLLFSTFGAETLQELKQSWAQVDKHIHVNKFYKETNIRLFLKETGFKNIQIGKKCYESSYTSVVALMKELKDIGANKVFSAQSQNTISRMKMQLMIATYEKNYQTKESIPATYEVIFVSAQS